MIARVSSATGVDAVLRRDLRAACSAAEVVGEKACLALDAPGRASLEDSVLGGGGAEVIY